MQFFHPKITPQKKYYLTGCYCDWHSAPCWPDVWLYDFGCLPITLSRPVLFTAILSSSFLAFNNNIVVHSVSFDTANNGGQISELASILYPGMISIMLLLNCCHKASEKVLARQPWVTQFHRSTPGQQGALCQCQGWYSPPLKVNRSFKWFWKPSF